MRPNGMARARLLAQHPNLKSSIVISSWGGLLGGMRKWEYQKFFSILSFFSTMF
jgi:hypothetical protein